MKTIHITLRDDIHQLIKKIAAEKLLSLSKTIEIIINSAVIKSAIKKRNNEN